MKKTLLFIVVLLLSMPLVLLAHPPKKVKLEYNAETGILKVNIPHPVKDVGTHYIEKITISVNGKEVKIIEYKTQSTKEAHVAEIELPNLEKGSKVAVNAKCNKMGSKTVKLEIE